MKITKNLERTSWKKNYFKENMAEFLPIKTQSLHDLFKILKPAKKNLQNLEPLHKNDLDKGRNKLKS